MGIDGREPTSVVDGNDLFMEITRKYSEEYERSFTLLGRPAIQQNSPTWPASDIVKRLCCVLRIGDHPSRFIDLENSVRKVRRVSFPSDV